MDRLDALRLFVEIAEAGSFSAAARKKDVSTSTATLALQKLEDELGARLIIRTQYNFKGCREPAIPRPPKESAS